MNEEGEVQEKVQPKNNDGDVGQNELKSYEIISIKRRIESDYRKPEEIPEEKNLNNNLETKAMSNEILRGKYPKLDEDNKESTEFNYNKKLRNTMPGLKNNKMKYERGLIETILKVEKDNVNHYLKGDLAELYEDITKANFDFKENVFLPNVDNFERRTGILDKNPVIPYNSSSDISWKLESYPKTNEIISKFAERSKNFTKYKS